MSILKIFTNTVDLSVPGGSFSTNTTYHDQTRVSGAFLLTSSESATVQHDQVAGDTTWYHFRYAQSNVSTSYDGNVLYIRTPTNDNIARMVIDNGQPFFSADGDTTVSTSTFLISGATVYSVDVSVQVTPTQIVVSGYFNNVLVGTATAANTTGLKPNPDRVTISNSDSAASVYYSECIVADEDTRGFRLRELRPQSFGVDQAWSGDVNDIVDDDLATGVSTETTGARVNFGVSNLENISSGDIVNRVVAQTYAQRGETGLTRINHYFRYPDATTEDGSDITVTTDGVWYLTEFADNPKTAAAWVPADFAGIQLGIRAQT